MDDIYYNILLHLPINDIFNACQTNKQFYKVSKYEQLWKHIYITNNCDNEIVDTYYNTCRIYYCILKLNKKFDLDIGMTLQNHDYIWYNYKDINEIPTELLLLSNMETLDLSVNKIRSIPTELSSLKNLKKLQLSSNNIKNIPTEIALLLNLELLDLSFNMIELIPTTIGLLNNNCHLFLYHNYIYPKPKILNNFKSLSFYPQITFVKCKQKMKFY